MATVITDNQHYADIAAAIREKNGTATLYKPAEMAAAVRDISAAYLTVASVGELPTDAADGTIAVVEG